MLWKAKESVKSFHSDIQPLDMRSACLHTLALFRWNQGDGGEEKEEV